MSRISQKTLNEIKEIDLADFAYALGDELKEEGRHFYTYRNGGEKTPSLCITPDMRRWTAFGSIESGSDPISYYAYRKWNNPSPSGKEFIEAVEAVAHIAGIEIEYEDGSKKIPEINTEGRRLKPAPALRTENFKKDNSVLNQYFRFLMEEFPLTQAHANQLRSEKRRLSDRQINLREYRSLPSDKKNRYLSANKIINHLGEAEGIPGFMLCQGKQAPYWTIGGKPGLLLPFRDIYNQICGFQIRYDSPQTVISVKGPGQYIVQSDKTIKVADKSTGEVVWEGIETDLPVTIALADQIRILSKHRWYGWLASNPNPKMGVLKGTSNGDPAPYHCAVPSSVLEHWKPGRCITEVMDTSTVWWGEGPLKGDIAADFTDEIHLQAAGVSSWRILLEPTLNIKPKKVILGFDADAQSKEDSVGKAVLQCFQGARQILNSHGIEVSFYIWPEQIAKGIDDLFLAGFKGQIYPR